MASEDTFLQAIRENPGDRNLRLVFADWLEEHGLSERGELIRVCEAMRQVPVFADAYWQLKARRNELRPCCPADWLAATGCDGSRYDPLFRDGIPEGWKGRWRLTREFTERWHGIPMGDVGGRSQEVLAEERRLVRTLPPSLREYVAYAHDIAQPGNFGIVHRDVYTMEPMEGHRALSIMMIAEGNVQWAVRDDDLHRDDPPVHGATWAEDDETRYVFAEEVPDAPALTNFVLGFVIAYKPNGGRMGAHVADAEQLRKQLDDAFPIRTTDLWMKVMYEGDGILVSLYPNQTGPGFNLEVCVHETMTWERVPSFLWEHAQPSNMRSGMFLSEQDRQQARAQWGDDPLPDWLGPTPPPLREPPSPLPFDSESDDEIPF